ncbi:MAG TPA: LytTR family DNA-binding domain-containing protein [Chitinophagaceae bacterium]
MYKCLVIEDEPLAQQVLRKYITDHPMLQLTGICNDALEAQQLLSSEKIAILFLDINLPKLSGINFLKSLPDPPAVIFTTAYPEFAVEGFDLNAIDYLMKPFSFERFLKAVHKAIDKLKQPGVQAVPEASRFIFLKADKKVFRVDTAEILYCEAVDDYVKVFTTQEQYFVHYTLKKLLEELPSGNFLRVHKSYIIAKDKIRFFEGNYVKVGDKDIPIGASYRDEIYARLKDKNL